MTQEKQTSPSANAIEVDGLVKQFGAVVANDHISLSVTRGSVHGIVGENGAGKSTLLKMLFGLYKPDAGTIAVGGVRRTFSQPSDAMAVGVGMVHQHFMLVETFTVLENIMLGFEGGRMLSNSKARARAALEQLERDYGFDLPLDTLVSELSVGVRQRAEILKALYRGADILILDEPTAVLTPQETNQLFALIRLLKEQGKTILFVTHKLGEIMEVTDRVTVIRGGKVVGEVETNTTSPDALAEMMVGARITRQVQREAVSHQREIIRVENVRAPGSHGRRGLEGVSFTLKRGEVLGVAGVAGNGQTELLEALTGLRAVSEGRITFGGVEINGPEGLVNPIVLRRMGMAHVAEDRLKTGAVEDMTAAENAVLGYQREPRFSRGGRLRLSEIAKAAASYFETQDVRPRDPSLLFGGFSGGNQQKLVIARELAAEPDVMIIGQPTRGVDIGAVTRIHDQIMSLRNTGKALLVVSADLDELLAVSDRIAVMSEGEIVGILPIADADETTLGLMMAGQRQNAAAESAESQTAGRV